MIIQLFKLLINMFRLKVKPDAMPYSKVLLVIMLLLVFIEKNIANLFFARTIQKYLPEPDALIFFNIWQSSIIVLISLLLMWAAIFGILTFYKLANRAVQVMSVMAGMDIILNLLLIIWMSVLYFAPVPLVVNSLLAWGLVLSFIFLLYWQFVVYIYVFTNSVNITILQSGVFALLYMLIQHNVAEWLMELMLHMDK